MLLPLRVTPKEGCPHHASEGDMESGILSSLGPGRTTNPWPLQDKAVLREPHFEVIQIVLFASRETESGLSEARSEKSVNIKCVV